MTRRPPSSTLTDTRFPYATLFRSLVVGQAFHGAVQPAGRFEQLDHPLVRWKRLRAVPFGKRQRQRLKAVVLQHQCSHLFGHVLQRSEEHTSELQSLMRISYAVFCLKKKNQHASNTTTTTHTH